MPRTLVTGIGALLAGSLLGAMVMAAARAFAGGKVAAALGSS